MHLYMNICMIYWFSKYDFLMYFLFLLALVGTGELFFVTVIHNSFILLSRENLCKYHWVSQVFHHIICCMYILYKNSVYLALIDWSMTFSKCESQNVSLIQCFFLNFQCFDSPLSSVLITLYHYKIKVKVTIFCTTSDIPNHHYSICTISEK